MTEQGPDDPKRKPAKLPPPMLDYGSKRYSQAHGRPWGEMFIGFLSWIGGFAAVVMTGMASNNATAVLGVLVITAAALIWGGTYLHLRGWRGFVPGLLIGFAITCLLPFGIAAVICGSGGFRGL